MRSALGLARRALGQSWPNPAVGCVLVQPGDTGDRVVGRGWTQPGGRPHGETEALARAGAAARGATAYVSLEPCNHQGKTPPCAPALVKAGVVRAVIPIEDPDPRVSGRGIAHLKEAGIETVVGICADEATVLNQGFFLRLSHARPLVTLKLATSLDGRIATGAGESQWITGSLSRRKAHLLRAEHDAVMVGIGTALADDPALTCRLDGLAARSPVRVVLDSRLRLPVTSRLVAGARETPLWIVTRKDAEAAPRDALERAGARIIAVEEGADGRVDVTAALEGLAQAGITRVMTEGGGILAGGLLAAGLVDRVEWFRAPTVIGGDGRAAVEAFGAKALADAAAFERVSVGNFGADMLESYCRRP